MHFDRCPRAARNARRGAVVRAISIGFVLCAALQVIAAQAADLAASVVAINPWIRWLPAGLPAAAYVTLRNTGDETITLVGADTRDFSSIMFHQSRNQHGTEQMLPLQRVQIAPHSQLNFAPQSYHIMLMQPTRPIHPGEHVLVRLHFAAGQSLSVEFDVRNPDGSRADSPRR